MKQKRIIVILIVIGTLSACMVRLKKGLEALEVYDYFKAKHKFEKVMTQHPLAAKYGLSVIYLRRDNPFHNIDSAYRLIDGAISLYPDLKPNLKLKYSELGIDSMVLIEQRLMVGDQMFTRAKLVNSEFGFQDFIDKNPWHSRVDQAIVYRDSLFFETALAGHKSSDFKAFMVRYPNSKYYQKAKANYEQQLFVEQTKRDNLSSYVNFLKNNPDSPFRVDAEDRIYQLETADQSILSYENFINTYPKNKNILMAWQALYDVFLEAHPSDHAIADFILRYPATPYKKELERELKLSKTYFYPIREQDVWGFLSEENLFKIPSQYEFIEPFSEGLAAVTMDGKVGYITKTGSLKIPYQFEEGYAFHEGYAVVEDKGNYGMINRQGQYVIPPDYDDLGTLVDGLIPFEKEGQYGYFDRKGNVKIQPIFSDAFNFEGGLAKVKLADKWGLINTSGNYVIDPHYIGLKEIKDSIYALNDEGNWGALNLDLDTIIPFDYEAIGSYSNGYYLVTKNDSFNYRSVSGEFALNTFWQPIYPEYKILAKYTGKPVLVLTEKGYNYMTFDGKLVFKYAKESLSAYDTLISFSKGHLWGFLSPDPPLEVVEPKYDAVKPFQNGYGIVSLSPYWGLINKQDDVVIDFKYNDIEFLNDSLLLVKQNDQMGVLTVNNDTIIPFIEGEIELYREAVVSINSPDRLVYFNLKTLTWISKVNE